MAEPTEVRRVPGTHRPAPPALRETEPRLSRGIDLPVPAWAQKKKGGRGRGRGIGASATAPTLGGTASTGKFSATGRSSAAGGAGGTSESKAKEADDGSRRLDHRNVPARWSRKGGVKKDPRYAKPATRKFPHADPVAHAQEEERKKMAASMTSTGVRIEVEGAEGAAKTEEDSADAETSRLDVLKARSRELALLLDLLGPDASTTDLSDVVPLAHAPDDESFLRLDQSKLPLEMFDNEDFEKYPPEEWLSLACAAMSPYYDGTSWRWMPCDVLAYEAEMGFGRYLIEFHHNGKQKYVKRINLIFDAENRANFCNRLRAAMASRERTKAAIRFQHYIEQQPEDSTTPISDAWLKGIHARATSFVDTPAKARRRVKAAAQRRARLGLKTPQAKARPAAGGAGGDGGGDEPQDLAHAAPDPASVSSLFGEVVDEYDNAMRISVLFQALESDAELKAEYEKLRLPPPPVKESPPRFGKVTLPDEEYEESRTVVGTSMRYRHDAVSTVFQWVSYMWHDTFAQTVFMDVQLEGLKLPITLHTFKSAQRKHGKGVAMRLGTEWRRGIANCLVDNTQNLYNFFESDVEAHMNSDLHHLVKLLEIIMADQLRDLVVRSATEWVTFLDKFSPPPLTEEQREMVQASADAVAAARAIADRDAVAAAEAAAKVQRKAKAEAAHAREQELVDPQPSAELLALEEEAKALAAEAARSSEAAASVPPPDLPAQWTVPLFDVDLIIVEGVVEFSPSVEEIEKVMLSALTTMVSSVRSLQQIEGEVLSLLHMPTAPILNVGTTDPPTDTVLQKARRDIKQILARDFARPRQLASLYQRHVHVLEISVSEYVADFVARGPDLAAYTAEVEHFAGTANAVEKLSNHQELYGLVRVQCEQIKTKVATRARKIVTALLDSMVSAIQQQAADIADRYEKILTRIKEKPRNEEELVKLKAFIKESEVTVENIEAEVSDIHNRLELPGRFDHRLSGENFHLVWSLREWPNRVVDATQISLNALEEDKVRMMEKLEKEKQEFEGDLERFMDAVATFKTHSDPDNLVKIVDEANNLDNDLRTAAEKAEDFNNREKVFGFQPTEYALLAEMQKEFDPFFRLWTMLSDFRSKRSIWTTGPFLELSFQEIERDVMDWWGQSYKLMKSLAETAPGPSEVAALLRRETDEFKQSFPVIQALASPALKDRHWERLSDVLGKDINPDEDLTLQSLLDEGILDHWEKVEEITVVAEKEYGLEKALDAMVKEWDGVEFEVLAYKTTGTYVVKATDDIATLMDDQIVKVQTMMGSPFIKPIAKKAKGWEKRLLYTQELLDEWLACQRTWMYLEPIFGSEDIMRQMPVEGRRFNSVDTLWRKTMNDVFEEPRVMEVSSKEKMLDKFQNANKLLDQIQKGLNDYLEVKRLFFPRFFFLSNDELLEILSQTKDPRAVQPHLGKCFEGIGKVQFRGEVTGKADDLTIQTMISVEGEPVPLLDVIDPNKPGNKGNVEKWLKQLESSMRITVKDVVKKSMAAYPTTERGKWVLEWPGQVVLCVSSLYWTQEAEAAMRDAGAAGLAEYLDVLNEQLQDIVQLVRGKLTKLERVTMGALCVVDVHARDVMEACVNRGVDDPFDFNWMSQLRYYWEEKPDDYNRYGEDPFNMLPRIINATQMYGYEYLGNSSRLVITPLTDRCYRTLMGAVVLMYGGAPAGPAGTGKTETVKDLSKAVAIQCVVFNCSDGLDYLAMAKFFKGLASTGAWSCFDEFNRIELEVLSVIAQQILTIQKAKRMRVAKFVFEGTTLSLNPEANCFITMNPGYAGRSELPDNLKALFRPCAMMVPDYALIAEIKLYSFGFADARNMARKLTQVLRLCSEQLSSQKHYDYGMRAVFSILVRAGNLRQQLGDTWSEDLIVLSSINDVNLPKFTRQDIPLFKGITQDLFPGVTLPQPAYDRLMAAIIGATYDGGLQPKDEFIRSTVQLYETVMVRHGLMIVGRTCSGKTEVLRTLARAMSSIKDDPDFVNVQLHPINPKSITQGQLYGNFDENTHEWTDGILAVTFRDCAKDKAPDRHWLVFDGPVDAVWIENMNTVLDDNKKLCLMSGEIIKMSGTTTMMFEPEDLEEASPATVSRVGMVFMEPARLGWRPYMQSWLADRKSPGMEAIGDILDKIQAQLVDLFEWLCPPLLFYIQRSVRLQCPVTDSELVHSLVNLFTAMLQEVAQKPPKDSDLPKVVESLFVFCVTWTIGVTMDAPGRVKFDEYFRTLLAGNLDTEDFAAFKIKNPAYDAAFVGGGLAQRAVDGDVRDNDPSPDSVGGSGYNPSDDVSAHGDGRTKTLMDIALGERSVVEPFDDGKHRTSSVPLPDTGLLHDYGYDPQRNSWNNWMKGFKDAPIAAEASFNSILVPTIDTVRNAWVVDILVRNKKHVLCVGDTGTGKSVSMMDKLENNLDRETYMYIPLAFSAQTSANQTQDIIDGKMNRRRKGVYGPPLGVQCIVFVDDLNMPAKETYGAQPPIEILRQWMDHGGWYDRKDIIFNQIVDMQFICAMGPPGGGRTRITQRYVRHFNILGFVPFDSDSLKRVFGTISNWFLAAFPGKIKSVAPLIVEATIDMYNTIAKELLPTPLKSHYTFNLRDLAKVFQGMSSLSADKVETPIQLFRMWSHECMRVFYDRLVDDKDRRWFMSALSERVSSHFKKNFEREVRGENKTMIYGNFGDPRAAAPVYEEIVDHEKLRGVMNDYLDDYNAMSPKQMGLVLFMNAIEHVARISRVINQSYGNALLVGVGGSGRKSLTTLAVFMAEYTLFQVEISKVYGMAEWRDDLKRMFRLAGEDGKPTVFLFSDTQIVKESFVEDINNILNNGEVPNLWLVDERAEILESMNQAAKKEGRDLQTPTQLYAFFVERCRLNLHVVLCFSPIGDAFRTRLRMFPSLVNCCTIDWFTEWPEEALRSVADHFLADQDETDEVKRGVTDVCVDMQLRVSKLSHRFRDEMRRYYYVTPTSYLELINTFRNLLGAKREQVLTAKTRYENGLTKLVETAAQVADMQVELEELQPKLKVASEETEKMIAKITISKKQASEMAETVAVEEKQCSAQAADAEAQQKECQDILDEALPALENAIGALKTLKKSDISEVKAMKKPPDGVKLTMEAVCIMLEVAPKMVPNPAGKGPKVPEYWEAAQKKVLGNANLLKDLMAYDRDNIKVEVIDKVTPYTKRDDFTPEIILKASKAASGLCKWVHAMVVYDRVAKIVGPKKEALKIATAELNAAMAALAGKQAELKEVEDRVAALEAELKVTMDKKDELERQVADCSAKLGRATRLIDGLGGERDRWTQFAKDLQVQYDNVVGDVLISSGLIAYLGAFTANYRDMCIEEWSVMLRDKAIPCAAKFSLADTLGDPVQIRAWTIAKLPNDGFSIDNAIMLYKSKRWPLMIDPQGQANQWVRRTEADNGLKVVKQTQSTFVRTIENCIQFGSPVLLENVPEVIDPVLESVLLRQVVKVGGIMSIRVGDNVVEYDTNFKLYITTKLSSPHYPPETCVKVNLLNFVATQEGLHDQMLGIVVKEEVPELEKQREQLVLEDAENKRQLKEIEDKILALLAASEGNILDDEVLINTLSESKVTANQIQEQVKIAERTQAKIKETRDMYNVVAKRVALLFFAIADLASIDPMYQYSLEWYVNLFKLAIKKSPTGDKETRLKGLNDTFTFVLYENVCRSLFEKDKLLFSFLLATKIQLGDNLLPKNELRFALQGSSALDLAKANPAAGNDAHPWLTDTIWGNVIEVAQLGGPFEMFDERFAKNLDAWKAVFEAAEPIDLINEMFTSEGWTTFRKLCVLRCLRPDKVIPLTQEFVSESIGEQFISPPAFNLNGCFEDSSMVSPLIFVLSPGADPMTELNKLADKLGYSKRLNGVSLGQGQGPRAEAFVSEAIDKGTWVCLQNCHLAESWMPTLERLCEEITPERTHPDFRLWLTAMPSPAFPVSVLQNGVKMTLEPPKGMRNNLTGSYLSLEEEWFESSYRPDEFKKLVFGLCFFHATVRERRKFGPLGWNIPYEFSEPDLRISLDQLAIFLGEEYPDIPFDTLNYLAGECNYGGRVTDDKDRRCILNVLSDFYTPDILDPEYTFSPSGIYRAPPTGNLQSYVDYIRSLPINERPEVYGMHENADITFAMQETTYVLSTVLSLQPRTAGGEGMSWDDKLMHLAKDIGDRVPALFDIEKVMVFYPTKFEESMNTVLVQELMRFNKLVARIKSSLSEVQRAIKGIVVMSQELEEMGNAMVKNRVPDMWNAVSYPSLKPLGTWVNDLLARLQFFNDWIDNGKPNKYWVSGFFFTQSFLTGTRQNFARKYTIPIDEIDYDFRVLTPKEEDAITAHAEDGAYIYGLFLEGAGWDADNCLLVESRPKELYVTVPTIHMLPKKDKEIDMERHFYECPVYKTSERRGMLSTTGHSTNFVMMVFLMMRPTETSKHWVKRGVAMLTQLDD